MEEKLGKETYHTKLIARERLWKRGDTRNKRKTYSIESECGKRNN